MDRTQEQLDQDYKHVDNSIRYHNEYMMHPYAGPDPYLHNLEGNKQHHILLAKKYETEIRLYKFKHKLDIYDGKLNKEIICQTQCQ